MSISHVFIYIFSVFISSVSQILLKTSANKKYESRIREYLNPRVIIAYGIFFIATFVTIIAYKGIPLSLGPILETTGYLWVSLLGYFILKEKISRRKIIGLIVVVAGIVVSCM
ncbi:MAG: multidrug ABC transporter [Lachnospiraceae bacterium]|nr:multidrug ABC transporter [Lachnospiraceae bacterium]MCR5406440.1 multidrug ABC transporter [Lachnospiraceae bacterium]